MTNFQFLHPKFATLFAPAAGAEQRVHSGLQAHINRLHRFGI
jgi:hypothetical protein